MLGNEKVFLVILIFFLMLGVGTSLTKKDFQRTIKNKRAWGIGMISQFLAMPLIAFLLTRYFNLDQVTTLGLIIIASSPSGSSSNLITHYAEGNTALSVIMTCTSTLGAFIFLPFSLWFYLSYLGDVSFVVPYKNILMSLVFTIIPISIGIFLKLKNEVLAMKLEKAASIISLVAIFIIGYLWIPKIISGISPESYHKHIAISLLAILGLSIGYLLTKVFGIKSKERTAVIFETGVQNGPLAFAVISLSFNQDMALKVAEIPIIYGAISFFLALPLIFILRRAS